MNQTLWLDNAKVPKYHHLESDLSVDVCVIGGGIAGITTAFNLKDSGLKVALIEANELLHGTTGHTTAKITAQHGAIYFDLLKNYGEKQLKWYAKGTRNAMEFIATNIKKMDIDCDYEEKPAYLYITKESNIEMIEAEYNAAKLAGFDCELVEELPLPFYTFKALKFNHQAQFNPVKYLIPLIDSFINSGGQIYEHTKATDIEQHENECYTILTQSNVKINAKKIIITSHFPFYDHKALMFAKMKPERSYVLALKSDGLVPDGMFISYEEPKRSIRSASNQSEQILLIGGENHRTGTSEDTSTHYTELKRFAKEYFSATDVLYEWSTQDYVTVDYVPYIGRLNHDNDQILIATGFNKWGMTNGTLAGLLLSKLILGQEEEIHHFYSPSRFKTTIHTKNLVSFNSEVAYEYVKGKLKKADEQLYLQNNEACIFKKDGDKYGVYKDDSGKLFFVDITCPHLGCELTFNQAEKTWDCPCHGSRFSYTGEIVEGPAHLPLTAHKNKIDPNIF